MKLKKLIILTALLLLCGSAFSQGLEIKPMIKTGALFTTGNPTDFGFFAGGNVNIFRDYIEGFATYTQVGYFYGDKDHAEAQRTVVFLVVEKTFPELKGNFKPYIALGSGFLGEIKEGADENNMSFLLDVGGVIWQKVGLGFGAWYTPRIHEVFVSFNLNMTP